MRTVPIAALCALFALAACTQRVLTELPVGDGDGPAGGGRVDAGQPGTGSSGDPPPTAPTGSPSPSSNDAGATTEAAAPVGVPVEAGSGGLDSGGHGSVDAGAPDAPALPGDGGVTADLLAECVSQINSVRAQNGVYLYTESSELESYAALATTSDAHNGQRHSYFYATGGGGVAATEDELDGDQVAPGASAEATMLTGLQQDVQAQGQAFDNLVSQQLSQAGCGFAQDGAGNWWIDVALR